MAKQAISSGKHLSSPPNGKSYAIAGDVLPDVLAETLGHIAADVTQNFERHVEVRAAEARAFFSDLRAQAVEFFSLQEKRVTEAIAGIRNGVDGKDGLNGKDGAPGLNGADGRDGINGKDGAPGLNGADGRDGINGKDGAPGLNGEDGRDGIDGQPGPQGKDGEPGVGISDLIINNDGVLIVTMSNGHTKEVGRVMGIDGAPGRDGVDGKDGIDGKDGAPGLNGKDGANGLDGESGRDGINGKDGSGIADALVNSEGVLVLTYSDGRTKEAGRVRGADGIPGRDGRDGAPGGPPGPAGPGGPPGRDGKSFEDKGAWCQDVDYAQGNGVTFGGSYWIAQEQTRDKPSTGKAWRLAVRKGRDGKNGKD